MSFDRLQENINKMKNPTVVGLDPALEHIPPSLLNKYIKDMGETLEAAAGAVYEFNTDIIDSICDIVPAVKPQSAYYETLGPEGVMVLKMTCDYAKARGMYVIIDGKRNDIGSTAEAYSAAYLGTIRVGETEIYPFDADALTVNPYLGSDGIRPFIETAVKHDKAIFALVKTSNPSAGELQDLSLETERKAEQAGVKAVSNDTTVEKTVYSAVGDLIQSISMETIGKYGFTRVGAVIGATYPEELRFLRARLQNTFFLIPGYGTQGGTADDVSAAFMEEGSGAIINSSRAIIAAWKKTGSNHKDAARSEALRMRDELRKILNSTLK